MPSGINLSAEMRRRTASWVAREIMPHEPQIRAWLARKQIALEDIDEVVQEAYCRLALLDGVGHIESPKAYFFSIVRNLLIRRLKRQRIVPFEAIAEIDSYRDETPLPDRIAGGRMDLARVACLIAALPERCRNVVRLRKVEGWSQKRIAEHLGMTEKAVEKQVWLGIKAIRLAWARWEEEGAAHVELEPRMTEARK